MDHNVHSGHDFSDDIDRRISEKYTERVRNAFHSMPSQARKRAKNTPRGERSASSDEEKRVYEMISNARSETQNLQRQANLSVSDEFNPVQRMLIYGSADGGPKSGQRRLPVDVAEYVLKEGPGVLPYSMMDFNDSYLATREERVKELVESFGQHTDYTPTFIDIKRRVEHQHSLMFEQITVCPCVSQGNSMAVAVIDFLSNTTPVFMASVVCVFAQDIGSREHVATFVGEDKDAWFEAVDGMVKDARADAQVYVHKAGATTATHSDLIEMQMTAKFGLMEKCTLSFKGIIINKPNIYDPNAVEIG